MDLVVQQLCCAAKKVTSYLILSSVQFSRSVASNSLRPHESQHTRPPCLSPAHRVHPNAIMCIKSVMPSSHLILCRPLLLLSPIPPSIRVFSSESALHMRWPKYWSFSLSISPSNEHPGLFGSPCSPRDSQESSPTPQFKSISSSVFSFLYGPTLTSIQDYWKTIALTRWTFVGKVTSLLFNMLSRLVIAFLPKSKHLLISWFQSPSAVLLEAKKKICHCFHCFPIYLP